MQRLFVCSLFQHDLIVLSIHGQGGAGNKGAVDDLFSGGVLHSLADGAAQVAGTKLAARNAILMAVATLIMGVFLSLYIANTGTVPAADNAAASTASSQAAQ